MEKLTTEVPTWGFEPYLPHRTFCETQNLDNDKRFVDVAMVQATSHASAAGHTDDQNFIIQMEDTIGEDKIWGFDPDLSCLSFCATQSDDNDSHRANVPKVPSNASAQPFEPETNIVETRRASPFPPRTYN
ncbi:hypothetical protein N7509_006502 [Penicillium cosmopolitanum]|uniref:Uncharacterized protein n=1 Tax=Penicillium cosmopolitanum TaxID=1131564 RepID=A0A9X0B941_9EURO|nr:uncharacterized protein N7509_006502 [Penicillium cosmopolitanum]KAJ5394715.1 hypothetical protein N7509_006502 [Penicillium cosmopolitanum]